MITCMWFGYGGSSHLAEELRPMIEEELEMKLITIHEWDNADIKWNRLTVLDELKKADIIIIPSNYKEQPAKSNTRLTQALSLGKPVICSPLPAYTKIIGKTKCALTAKNEIEWKQCLEELKSKFLRDEFSKRALEVSKKFSIDSISGQWLNLFNSLEKVDIIIPTYNNLSCLKLCIESIRECTSFLYNIIVVNNGEDEEVHNYLDSQGDIVYIKKGRLNFAQAINIGLKAGKSKYVCLLNDDVIVSKNWLKDLVKICKNDIGVVGPLSNCDKGWQHNIDISIGNSGEGVNLLPGVHKVSEIEPIKRDIYQYDSKKNDVIERDWVAFYCTLISREVINKVGLLDEKFVNTGEDVDYCFRIRKQGYKIVQNYKSFVFHFGAVGRKILESKDSKKYHESDKETRVYLDEKWDKKNIVIYSGPSFERWDYRNLKAGGIGGSETWVIYLAREFSKLNYRVKVFCDCEKSGIKDGDIEYLHFREYPSYIEYNWIDYFISSRTTDTLNFPIRSGKNLVMIHDVFLSRDRNLLHSDKVDKFLCLSEEHKKFVMSHHNIPEDKILITANGLDLIDIKQKVKKKRFQCIYSSSPDRGLENLLYMFPFIQEKVPEAELYIYYGFNNILKIPDKKEWAENLLEKIEKIEGVFNVGRVDKKKLAKGFLESSVLLYPCSFEETFCVTVVEAMATKCAILSSNYWGLKDTVKDAGILLDIDYATDTLTEEYKKKFVKEAVRLLKDDDYLAEYQKKGFKRYKKFSWTNIAKVFDEYFKRDIWQKIQ